jgi:chemotaxis protein CheX
MHVTSQVPQHDVCAAVSITGAWSGHVVVACSDQASRHAAAALLGIDAHDVTLDDVADAMGEVANVIGGNVKSLLPDSCALSLPHVVPCGNGKPVWPAVTEICRLEATWLDEPVTVSVLESRADRKAMVPA